MAAERNRRTLPLRFHLTALLVLFCVATGAAVAFARVQAEADARRSALVDTRFAAGLAARSIARDLREVGEGVAATAATPGLAPLFGPRAVCALQFSGAGVFASGHLDFVRRDGSVACSSLTGARGTPYAGAAWLRDALSRPVVAGPVRDPRTGRDVLVSAAPVPAAGGVVAAVVELAPMGRALAQDFGGPRQIEFLLVTADGSGVVTRSVAPARWTGRPLSGTPFRGGSRGGRDVDGTARLYSSVPVRELGWTAYAGVDEHTAMAAARRLRDRTLVLSVLALMVAATGTWFIYRRVTRPIQRLQAAVREVASGGGARAVDVGGPTEVVRLVEDVNRLTEKVEHELAERRRAEAEARLSEQAYRLLFEGNPQPMWVYDVETLAFLQVNQAAVTRYGYGRDEFLRMTIEDLMPAADLPAILEVSSSPAVVDRSGPWRHLTHRGHSVEVEVTSHPLVFAGRPARFMMAEDVTERARLQRQLNQSQRLESLGQLAGGVAHDFNNLLAVILNYAAFVDEQLELAAAEDGTERWATVRDDVKQIQAASDRAARLTQQLLAFARRDVTQAGVLDVNAVVTGLESLLRRTLGEHVELQLALAPELDPVLADAGQLEQVVVNLAVNSRDAMPDGGRLTIDTGNVDVDADYASSRTGLEPGRYVRLRVSDTGIGIPKDVIGKVFEPFFTTKPRGQGTGLGLATVYGIVIQLGGHAQIYSEPGMGTTFTVLIPTTELPASAAEQAARAPGRGTGERILVVEDEDAMREVTRRILTRNGYQTVCAGNGHEALDIVSRPDTEVDLLLTDVVMPGLLGTELARQVVAARPGVRVLFMSGYAEPVLGYQGRLAPGVALVEKPFSETTLLAKVREVLDQ